MGGMAAVVEFDAGLFGTWPAAPVYDGRSTAEREAEDALQAAARALAPAEPAAGEPAAVEPPAADTAPADEAEAGPETPADDQE